MKIIAVGAINTLAVGSFALISGCSKAKPQFKSVDITGADYAQGFSLPDQNGQLRTLQDFRGKVVVVFFGYTQCPDECPTTLAELAKTKKLLGADGDKFQVVLISIDPQRDQPDVLKAYLANFDPSFVALRPDPAQLAQVAAAFKIYYKKVDGKTPTSYSVDHSAGSYVFGPQGHIRLYARYGEGAQAFADDVKLLLNP